MTIPIIGQDKRFEEMAMQAEAEEQQAQAMAEFIQIVTKNVIGNLMHAQVGFVYVDENNNQVIEPESPLGFVPERQHRLDSCYDLRAAEDFVIKPGERYVTNLRIGVIMPSWMDMFIMARSGHSRKKGIMVTNGIGMVDASFATQPIGVNFFNSGKEDWVVRRGDRIAQARFQMKGAEIEFREFKKDAKELQDKIGRGEGWGSSGTK